MYVDFFRLLINCYAAVKIIGFFDVSNYLFFVIENRLKRQIRITFRAVFVFSTIILLNENNLISVFFKPDLYLALHLSDYWLSDHSSYSQWKDNKMQMCTAGITA